MLEVASSRTFLSGPGPSPQPETLTPAPTRAPLLGRPLERAPTAPRKTTLPRRPRRLQLRRRRRRRRAGALAVHPKSRGACPRAPGPPGWRGGWAASRCGRPPWSATSTSACCRGVPGGGGPRGTAAPEAGPAEAGKRGGIGLCARRCRRRRVRSFSSLSAAGESPSVTSGRPCRLRTKTHRARKATRLWARSRWSQLDFSPAAKPSRTRLQRKAPPKGAPAPAAAAGRRWCGRVWFCTGRWPTGPAER